jgi:hypothetical protein
VIDRRAREGTVQVAGVEPGDLREERALIVAELRADDTGRFEETRSPTRRENHVPRHLVLVNAFDSLGGVEAERELAREILFGCQGPEARVRLRREITKTRHQLSNQVWPTIIEKDRFRTLVTWKDAARYMERGK